MIRKLRTSLVPFVFVTVATGALVASTAASAEHVRVTHPNALSVELLGRGMLYSVAYDRVVTDDLVAGVAYGSTSLRTLADVDAGESAKFIPIYASYYFLRDGNSPFVTAGANIVTHSSSVNGLKSAYGGMEFNSNAVLPHLGVGYESRSDAGFLFRATAYGILAKSFYPWAGLTLGYSF